MSPRDTVWNHLYRKIMKITSQAKDTIDESLQFGTQVFPMSQASKQFQPGRWTK